MAQVKPGSGHARQRLEGKFNNDQPREVILEQAHQKTTSPFLTLVRLGLEPVHAGVVGAQVFPYCAEVERIGLPVRTSPEVQTPQIILHEVEEVLETTIKLDGAADFQAMLALFLVTEFEHPVFFADETQARVEGLKAF